MAEAALEDRVSQLSYQQAGSYLQHEVSIHDVVEGLQEDGQ